MTNETLPTRNTFAGVAARMSDGYPHGLRSIDTHDGAPAELWFAFSHDRDAAVALFSMRRDAFEYVDLHDDGTVTATTERSEAMN